MKCVGCSSEFIRARPNQSYCSLACYRTGDRPSRRTGETRPCAQCGTEIYRSASAVRFWEHEVFNQQEKVREDIQSAIRQSAARAAAALQKGGWGARQERAPHVAVKPTELMRYLCRLVTPPGGTVLDPFAGSGSTLKAAELEGFSAIGIELDPAYVEIAKRRIASDAPLFSKVETA